MNVANVGAEIFDSVITAFTVVSVGVVNIPKCGEIVACKSVKHSAESCGVGIDSAGLYQNADVVLLCVGQYLAKCGINRLLIVVKCADNNVRHLCIVSNVDKALNLRDNALVG